MLRTHTCGELRKEHLNKEVVLCGWVHRIRSFGKLTFIDLRDRYGITQLVLDDNFKDIIKKLRRESVIQVKGKVKERVKINKNLPTGEIEVIVNQITILNLAEPLPLDLDNKENNTDETRLKYRYLDLRREEMKENIIFRHRIAQSIREFLNSQGFIEIETPMLVKSTPEGARDYIVPSRIHKGRAYALPQSPQLYKQILMIAGFDKYYQLARCLRDEDLRADRQPEFTQVDIEMSFVEEEDIFNLVENLLYYVFKKELNIELKIPFEKISYEDAIRYYGNDKPDLRFDLKLEELDFLKQSNYNIFRSGEKIKGIFVQKRLSKSELKELEETAKVYKAKGIITIELFDEVKGTCIKCLDKKHIEKLKERFRGGTLIIISDKAKIVNDALAAIRNKIGKMLSLYDEKEFKFCWIVDFPLFEWNEEEKRWEPSHHMFTMPKEEYIEILDKDPGKVKAQCYDLVLNGVELASGSIRVHKPELQEKIMKVIGLSHNEAIKKFGFLLEAYKYGGPPHGGIAIGFDRLVAMMKFSNDIRDFIAFPKNKKAENPMDGSPSEISERQWLELGLKVNYRNINNKS